MMALEQKSEDHHSYYNPSLMCEVVETFHSNLIVVLKESWGITKVSSQYEYLYNILSQSIS